MERRRMCPNCRAFIGAGDRQCPYCGIQLDAPAVSRSEDGLIGGVIPQRYFVTSLIMLINGVLFLVTLLESSHRGGGLMGIDGQTLAIFGAKESQLIRYSHQWWRLITAGFLHGGLLHIAMNSWVLLDLGPVVEDLFGQARLLVIYFVATVVGFYCSTLFTNALSVGASAGIMGLIGAMIAFGMHQRTSMGDAIKRHFVVWAATIFVFGFIGLFNVDNAAHFGGLVGGFVVAYIPGVSRQVWKALAGVCVAACAFAFFQMYRFMEAMRMFQ